MQSRAGSLLESVLNTVSGLALSWLITWLLLPPLFGIEPGAIEAAKITALYTAASIARNYAWRRLCNR